MPQQPTSLTVPEIPDIDLPVGVAMVGGALLGSLAGFLLLTARGARVRQDLALTVERLLGGLDTTLTSVVSATQRLEETRRAFSGRPATTPAARWAGSDRI